MVHLPFRVSFLHKVRKILMLRVSLQLLVATVVLKIVLDMTNCLFIIVVIVIFLLCKPGIKKVVLI